jgi:phosphatidylserine decarboxylase
MKTAIGNIKVIQVAGVMAKKIVCAVKEGQMLSKGDALGLIKLGSQVILVLPEDNVELKVKEKDKVKAGSGIIAEIIDTERGIFEW